MPPTKEPLMKKKVLILALAAGLCLAVAIGGYIMIRGATGGMEGAVAANLSTNPLLPSVNYSSQGESAPSVGSTKVVTVSKIYAEDFLKTPKQFASADVVVVGTILKVDTARWNSSDGAEWMPDESVAMPVPYTTFYIQPTQILKGTPKWDAPIPFRIEGGAFGPDAAKATQFATDLPKLQPGMVVIAFGKDEQRYGKGAVYSPSAYWLLSSSYSLFENRDGNFVSVSGVETPGIGSVTIAQLEALAAQ
jgi:hypothetical protein